MRKTTSQSIHNNAGTCKKPPSQHRSEQREQRCRGPAAEGSAVLRMRGRSDPPGGTICDAPLSAEESAVTRPRPRMRTEHRARGRLRMRGRSDPPGGIICDAPRPAEESAVTRPRPRMRTEHHARGRLRMRKDPRTRSCPSELGCGEFEGKVKRRQSLIEV